jgi:hypothetical protein
MAKGRVYTRDLGEMGSKRRAEGGARLMPAVLVERPRAIGDFAALTANGKDT